MNGLSLRRDDALSADALAMIAESEKELLEIYAPEHHFAFSPEQLTEARVVFFTAHLDGRVVGCGGMAPCDGYGEMKRIFVTKSERGKRIAAAIVAALEDEARRLDLPRMTLETGKDSPEAIRAYERLGYAHCGAFGGYQENGVSVFMEKQL